MQRNKVLETMLAITLGLLVIFYLSQRKNFAPLNGTEWLLPVSVLICAIGLFSNYLSEKIHWLWMKIAHIMGSIMSKILLGAIFYLFLFPLALISRLFKKTDSLQLKKSTGNSYYTNRNFTYSPKDFEDMF
jgi:hypothetical protein